MYIYYMDSKIMTGRSVAEHTKTERAIMLFKKQLLFPSDSLAKRLISSDTQVHGIQRLGMLLQELLIDCGPIPVGDGMGFSSFPDYQSYAKHPAFIVLQQLEAILQGGDARAACVLGVALLNLDGIDDSQRHSLVGCAMHSGQVVAEESISLGLIGKITRSVINKLLNSAGVSSTYDDFFLDTPFIDEITTICNNIPINERWGIFLDVLSEVLGDSKENVSLMLGGYIQAIQQLSDTSP